MPTYEYKCKKCGHTFELLQSIKDDPVKTCPVCKGAVERVIGLGGGLIFKGSGFYATDYRSDSYKNGAKADKPSFESKTASKDSEKKVSAEK